MISRSTDIRSALRSRQRGFIIDPYRFGGAPPTDPYFASVILLLHGEGANGGTTITDSSSVPRTMSVTGSITTSTTQSRFGSASLKVANGAVGTYTSADFTFAQGVDFTFETYVYHTAACDVFRVGSEAASRLALYIDASNNVLMNVYGESTVISCGSVSVSTWNHFRMSRQGSVVSVFLNGVWAASDGRPVSYDGTVGNGSLRFENAAADTYYDEFRVTRSVARDPYTLGAWPTNVTDDPSWASVVAYLKMGGTNGSTTFIDETGKTATALGNAQISTAQAFIGSASGLFDGTTDGVTEADHADFDFGSGAFTAEMYVRPSSFAATGGLLGKRATGGVYAPFSLYVDTTGKVGFLSSNSGSAWGINGLSDTVMTANRWCHVRYIRSVDAFKLYLNGGLAGSGTMTGALMTNTSAVSYGANAADLAVSLNGYLQHVRLTKGVARNSANFIPHMVGSANFTTQSAPHPDA